MNAEKFWDLYINSTQNTLDIYDEAIDFFSKKLPDNFIEEYDVVEVVLEIQGHHKTAKKFEKVINFINVIKTNHPDIYEESSVYSNDFLISYYSFFNNDIEVENVFNYASKNVLENFDKYIGLFKKLLFYQHVALIEKPIDSFFEEVSNCDNLISGAEYDFSIHKLYNLLEKQYLKEIKNNSLDVKIIFDELEKYGFDKINLEKSLLGFEKGFFDVNIDYKTLNEILVKDLPNAMFVLEARFMKSMLQKNFRFSVSAKIWQLMMQVWNDNIKKGKNYFEIDTQKFDKSLDSLSGSFFIDNSVEVFALLWGSIYIYDFLLENGLIDNQLHASFIDTSKELKSILIVKNPTSLWENNFVQKWQKPDSVSEIEFDAFTKIFEKSLTFNQSDFSIFKNEITPELEKTEGFMEFIIKEEVRSEKQKQQSNSSFNSFFDEKEDDFFIPPANLKPIVKEENEKLNRNDPCHCGSGKKFKKCCM